MDPSNLAAAFGIWSAVVGIGCAGIVFELSRLRKDLGEMANRLQTLTVAFEHRLTRVESDIQRCPANRRD